MSSCSKTIIIKRKPTRIKSARKNNSVFSEQSSESNYSSRSEDMEYSLQVRKKKNQPQTEMISLLNDEKYIDYRELLKEDHDFSYIEDDELPLLIAHLREYYFYCGATRDYKNAQIAQELSEEAKRELQNRNKPVRHHSNQKEISEDHYFDRIAEYVFLFTKTIFPSYIFHNLLMTSGTIFYLIIVDCK